MLKKLESLLSVGAIINLTVSKLSEDRINVIAILKNGEEKIQTAPLSISGTIDEVEEALVQTILDAETKIVTKLELKKEAFEKSIEPEEEKPATTAKKAAATKATVAPKKLTALEQLEADLDEIEKKANESEIRTEVYAQWKALNDLSKKHKNHGRIGTIDKAIKAKLLDLSDAEDNTLFNDKSPKPDAKATEVVDDGMGEDLDDPDSASAEVTDSDREEVSMDRDENEDPDATEENEAEPEIKETGGKSVWD